MQAIYYPKNSLKLNQNEKFYIKCNHDEYSLYFDIVLKPEHSAKSIKNYTVEEFLTENGDKEDDLNQTDSERSLGLTLVSRNRLAQLNDSKRNDMFIKLLSKVFQIFE
jgi:hypothetical protein